jgi:hypothetical protein
MEKVKGFLIYCSTGCTCCSYENHFRGPYRTKEDAERRMQYFLSPGSKYWPVASQYARRGRYSIGEVEIEKLPDGRIIIEDSVYPELKFIDVDKNGYADSNEEYFDSA